MRPSSIGSTSTSAPDGLEEDPFNNEVYQFTIPGVVLTYKRMPMMFPAP